jgi:NADPH:quinone reductase-like Zn-dependent oxidoreductase
LRSIETTKEFGVPESIEDREAPRPGGGEIVVAIQAAGVDAMDAVVVAGHPR